MTTPDNNAASRAIEASKNAYALAGRLDNASRFTSLLGAALIVGSAACVLAAFSASGAARTGSDTVLSVVVGVAMAALGSLCITVGRAAELYAQERLAEHGSKLYID